jgi:hypothetical protein
MLLQILKRQAFGAVADRLCGLVDCLAMWAYIAASGSVVDLR